VNDPPLNTKIYAQPLGSGQPNFPAFVACHTLLAHKINITQIAYSTRGNSTSGVVCQQYTNGTRMCDTDFPNDKFILWRVKISDPKLQKILAQGHGRRADDEDATSGRKLATPTAYPTAAGGSPGSPGSSYGGSYSGSASDFGGSYASPPGTQYYDPYGGPPVPPGTPTTPYGALTLHARAADPGGETRPVRGDAIHVAGAGIRCAFTINATRAHAQTLTHPRKSNTRTSTALVCRALLST